MAKLSSARFNVFLVDGVSMLGAKPKGVSEKVTNQIKVGTHGLGDAWEESSPTGIMKGEFSQSGAFFDDTADGMHAAFKAVSDVARVVCTAMDGNIIGMRFTGCQGAYVGSYDVAPKVGDLVPADATYAVSGQVDRGLIVQDWTTHIADWNTGNDLSLAIVRSGSTATATSTPAHGYAVGSTAIVTVADAVQTEYNGRQTVTFTGASTFTFTVSGTPATPATGTITGGVTIDYTLDPTNLSIPITSNSSAAASVVLCPVPHRLTSTDKVLISGVVGSSPDINGEQVATVLSPTTFSVPVDTSGAGSGGTGGKFVRANSNNGGVGYLEVSAASGFTNFVGKIQHSDDDVTYTDLITFADNVTAPFSERKAVVSVVKRYVRFDGNVTGSGSIRPFSGFKRSGPA